jgi:hypothetical protein
MKTQEQEDREKLVEVSKCCKKEAAWNFCFKYCENCGRRFVPLELPTANTQLPIDEHEKN